MPPGLTPVITETGGEGSGGMMMGCRSSSTPKGLQLGKLAGPVSLLQRSTPMQVLRAGSTPAPVDPLENVIRGRYKPGGPRVQRADAARNTCLFELELKSVQVCINPTVTPRRRRVSGARVGQCAGCLSVRASADSMAENAGAFSGFPRPASPSKQQLLAANAAGSPSSPSEWKIGVGNSPSRIPKPAASTPGDQGLKTKVRAVRGGLQVPACSRLSAPVVVAAHAAAQFRSQPAAGRRWHSSGHAHGHRTTGTAEEVCGQRRGSAAHRA